MGVSRHTLYMVALGGILAYISPGTSAYWADVFPIQVWFLSLNPYLSCLVYSPCAIAHRCFLMLSVHHWRTLPARVVGYIDSFNLQGACGKAFSCQSLMPRHLDIY
jgi:hypothetical protein